jgi:hypothetical protein
MAEVVTIKVEGEQCSVRITDAVRLLVRDASRAEAMAMCQGG